MALKFSTSGAMLALVVTLTVAPDAAWADGGSDFDSKVDFTCPNGRGLRSIDSEFSNAKGDRRWTFSCSRPVSGSDLQQNCTWTSDYVNKYRKPVIFACPADHSIAGIQSVHDSDQEDRRTKFYCCYDPSYKTSSCRLVPVNDWKTSFTYSRANAEIIAGWFSVYDDRDRGHVLLVCSYEQK